jgi:hypothetical protein
MLERHASKAAHLALDFMRAYPELCAEADRLTAKPVRTDLHAMMMERALRDPEAARHVRLWGESRPVHQLYRRLRCT